MPLNWAGILSAPNLKELSLFSSVSFTYGECDEEIANKIRSRTLDLTISLPDSRDGFGAEGTLTLEQMGMKVTHADGMGWIALNH